jgi:hypothetical protein
VVVPYKGKPAFNVAEITGPYVYDCATDNPYYHHRAVQWVARDVPRSNFDRDLLYSLGAFMTICRVARNDADARVRVMAAPGWLLSAGGPSPRRLQRRRTNRLPPRTWPSWSPAPVPPISRRSAPRRGCALARRRQRRAPV